MARKVRAYTEIGRRIANLGNRQREIAKVLHVSQQTVSKKLRGETAILLADLERLGAHYRVPLTYFFEEGTLSGELAAAWERVKKGPAALREVVVLASGLPETSVERVLELAKFIAQGAKSSRRGGKAGELLASESPERYGDK